MIPTSTTTTTTAAAGCHGVTAAAGQTDGAAGTITGSITLSDSGGISCPLTGYPSIELFSSNGSSIPVTIMDGLSVDVSSAANAPPAAVTLSPSSAVEFTYQISDVPTGNETTCPTSSTAVVTLPGGAASTPKFTLTMDPCDNGTIRVSPLYAAS